MALTLRYVEYGVNVCMCVCVYVCVNCVFILKGYLNTQYLNKSWKIMISIDIPQVYGYSRCAKYGFFISSQTDLSFALDECKMVVLGALDELLSKTGQIGQRVAK